jgi:hypothetical protein
VLELFEATCVPSDTLAVGALIDSAPAVTSKVVGVAAPAGKADVAESTLSVPARRKSLRIFMTLQLQRGGKQLPHRVHRHPFHAARGLPKPERQKDDSGSRDLEHPYVVQPTMSLHRLDGQATVVHDVTAAVTYVGRYPRARSAAGATKTPTFVRVASLETRLHSPATAPDGRMRVTTIRM